MIYHMGMGWLLMKMVGTIASPFPPYTSFRQMKQLLENTLTAALKGDRAAGEPLMWNVHSTFDA